MKNIFCTVVTLLISQVVSCQSLDQLRKVDTLYIEFKGKKGEKKYDIQTRLVSNDFNEKKIQFNIKKTAVTVSFEHLKYKNLDKKNANIISEEKEITKEFLRKNKTKTISISLLKQYSYEEIVCEILSSQKIFYIIDYTGKKDIIYEVNSMNYCPSIE